MSIECENSIVTAFEELDVKNFRVHLELRYIFLCGGDVDGGANIPPSLRDRFFSYTSSRYPAIHDSVVLAERFKDYFKENAYPDLFVFEKDIASLSSVVMIFLESPGSLVELGMFCSMPQLYHKLVIVAPQKEIEPKDSFIYLGPLENIKRKYNRAVLVYPWPEREKLNYNNEHLVDMCEAVQEKWREIPKTTKFNDAEPGHLAFLIADLVRICFPVTITEIELALMSVKINLPSAQVHRLLYLLERLEVIKIYDYGGYNYYYYVLADKPLFDFNGGKKFDIRKIRIALRKTYFMGEDAPSRKRRGAMQGINSYLEKAS